MGSHDDSDRIEGAEEAFELDLLSHLKDHPSSVQIDGLFSEVYGTKAAPEQTQTKFTPRGDEAGDSMSDKDKELSLDGGAEFELDDLSGPVEEGEGALEDGLDLSLDEGMDLSLGDEDLSLDGSEGLSLNAADEPVENLGELDFGNLGDLSLGDIPAAPAPAASEPPDLDLGGDLDFGGDLDLGMETPAEAPAETPAETPDAGLSLGPDDNEMSDDVKEKLREIDEIMDSDSRIDISARSLTEEADEFVSPDIPLVSEDIAFEDLGFSAEEEQKPAREAAAAPEKSEPEKPKKKKKENTREMGEELKEISGAYTGELERLQATLSNLRSDREELLSRIQALEDDKVLHNRQTLSLRAELDEKKIELSIIRRKLNEEITELKDKLRVQDEKRLILEEKNRLLQQELERAGQKNKLDVKKVQMRERELEQKLELLKADAETQIRNRDLKILELKRKIDSMEFDMESISTQEKKSVESRYELEDKLEKAIKTLRSAITVLEEEGHRNTVDTLKKNIDV